MGNTNSTIETETQDIARALYELLGRYIDLLESSEHGGWSLEEDEAVRTAGSVLSQAGWTVTVPVQGNSLTAAEGK